MNIMQRYKAKKKMLGATFYRNNADSPCRFIFLQRYKLVRNSKGRYCLAQTSSNMVIPNIEKEGTGDTYNSYHDSIKELVHMLIDPTRLTYDGMGT